MFNRMMQKDIDFIVKALDENYIWKIVDSDHMIYEYGESYESNHISFAFIMYISTRMIPKLIKRLHSYKVYITDMREKLIDIAGDGIEVSSENPTVFVIMKHGTLEALNESIAGDSN